jgi:hypothetical protein
MPLYEPTPAADQPVVQARRTTTFALSGAFADVSLDTTDIESNNTILDHDAGTPDQIIAKVAGNFSVEFSAVCPAGASLQTSFRVRKNDSSVLVGSEQSVISGGTDAPLATVKFVAALGVNDFITLQAMASTGTPNLAAGLTMAVVHLAGERGEKGDASATDVDAIHKTTSAEISTITEKTTPVSNDLLVIEDSADSNSKKRLKIGNLPGGVSLASAAPVDVTKAAAAVGDGTTAARNNHKHDISTAAPAALAVNNSADEGNATSLARSNHQHAVPKGTPVDVGTANAAGAGTDFAAGNHVHAGLTRGAADFAAFTAKATPAAADLLLIEDSAAANAKKKSTLAQLLSGGLAVQIATGVLPAITTSSTSDVLATSMTITPAAGTYLVWFSGSVSMSSGGADLFTSVWAAGSWYAASERVFRRGNQASYASFACGALVVVNGAQAIEGRWRVASNTGTMYQRTLVILKVA